MPPLLTEPRGVQLTPPPTNPSICPCTVWLLLPTRVRTWCTGSRRARGTSGRGGPSHRLPARPPPAACPVRTPSTRRPPAAGIQPAQSPATPAWTSRPILVRRTPGPPPVPVVRGTRSGAGDHGDVPKATTATARSRRSLWVWTRVTQRAGARRFTSARVGGVGRDDPPPHPPSPIAGFGARGCTPLGAFAGHVPKACSAVPWGVPRPTLGIEGGISLPPQPPQHPAVPRAFPVPQGEQVTKGDMPVAGVSPSPMAQGGGLRSPSSPALACCLPAAPSPGCTRFSMVLFATLLQGDP